MRTRAAVLGLALAVMPATGHAQDAAPPLDEHDVARLRNVTDAVVAPDGRHVAFTVSVPRDPFTEPDGAAWSRLHVLDVASGTATEYVGGTVNVRDVRWWPGSGSIAFLARRDEDATSLYRIPLEGGEAVRVLSHDPGISAFDVSPDGRRIAFLAREPEPKRRIELRNLGFRQEIYEEDDPFTRVWVAPADGSEAPRMLPLDGHASHVAWSPDGTRLLVVLAPTPLVDDSYMRRRIRVVDAGSGEILLRVENPGKLGQLAWAPDGAHVAYVAAESRHDPKEGRLMVARLADGTTRELLPGLPGHVSSIAWTDGRTVRYVADLGVETEVGSVRVDGSGRRTVVAQGVAAFTELSVGGREPVTALVGSTATHPAELYVLGREAKTPSRMTDSNPWLAGRTLGRQETVRWTARDGLDLEGLLIHSVDGPAGPHPLIVVVHGGPESHYRNGWLTGYSSPGQVSAGRGFAVFYPNYRASTGRGVEFSMLDHGDFAGAEFDDIVDGVDHLIADGVADPARVGVTGGSYGGYATAWLSTRYSRRFAAGVMFVGIANLISKDGVSDIPEEMHLVHQRIRPWEDWDLFLERSPIFWADSARTPLLILHGTADPRVPTDQSIEMYRNVKLRGEAPVRLVLYPGEGHGNRRAAARLDYNLRSLRWLEHYLTGSGGEPPPPDIEVRDEEPAARAAAGG
ncbi:MAG: S9 family peptidase [Gemmatimonadota bacterium]|nr:S9 family peptidase [Gemmatimonadota bacterium]